MMHKEMVRYLKKGQGVRVKTSRQVMDVMILANPQTTTGNLVVMTEYGEQALLCIPNYGETWQIEKVH